jgi:hypothetical protein
MPSDRLIFIMLSNRKNVIYDLFNPSISASDCITISVQMIGE